MTRRPVDEMTPGAGPADRPRFTATMVVAALGVTVSILMFLAARWSSGAPWIELGIGLLITLLVTAYLHRMAGMTARVHRLVDERTAALSQANARLSRQAEAANLLHQVTALAAEADCLEDMLEECVRLVCRMTGWPIGHVYFPAPEHNGALVPAGIWHLQEPGTDVVFLEAIERATLAPGAGLPGRVLAAGGPAWIANVLENDEISRLRGAGEIGIRGAFAFPVAVGPDTIAVAEFFCDDVLTPDEDLVGIMRNVGTQIGRVAERLRALEALRHGEEQLRAVVTNVIDGIITIDGSGSIRSYNEAAERMFGHSAADVIGQNVSVLMPEPHRSAHQQYINRYLETGKASVIGIGRETVGQRKDGSTFPMELAVNAMKLGEETMFVGVSRDITERKRAEDELRASEQRFQVAVAGSSDGLWDWNLLTNEVYYSPRFKALLGYEDHEIPNTYEAWESRLHPDDRVAVLACVWAHLEDRRPYDIEYRLRTKNGEDRWFRARGQAIWNDGGRATRMAGSLTDITPRKRDEENLRRTNEQLEAARTAAETANRAKSEFLASMSHELRTPLNAIIGFTDGLLRRADRHPLTGHQENRLTRVKLAGQHLLSLINDVLDIAKIEAGEMRVNVTPFDAGDLAREVGDLAEALFAEKPGTVSFRLEIGDDLPTCTSDRDKVKQILMNLLSNAAKFTQNGSVDLRVRRDNGAVLFSVQDTGQGIPQAELHKVFEKFHQVGGIHREGGTGLGLALCKEFAELLGGALTVRSVEGEGSTFALRLPVAGTAAARRDHAAVIAQIHERARACRRAPGQKVVLCIEDNPTNMLLLQDYLTEAGFHVIPLLDSAHAMKIAESEGPDVIVLDVMMPGLDGWELLRRLKSNEGTRHLPVILATAIDDEDLGLSLGASDFLTKPIAQGQLLESVARVTGAQNERGCRIAVVDDDPIVRERVREVLEDHGHLVRSFADGAVFLEVLSGWRPEAVLLDLMMPTVDGFAVVEAMQSNPAWREIPIIVLTAMTLSSEQVLELNQRVLAVIQKNGMSRDRTLQQVVSQLEKLAGRGLAA